MKKKLNVVEVSKKNAPKKINLALVIVSTMRFNEKKSNEGYKDEVIPKVKRLLKENKSISLTFTDVIPNSEELINNTLIKLMKDQTVDSIIFCGGTGFSVTDITCETIEPRLEKKINGFGELFRSFYFNEIGSAAMLSRATAGILRSKKKNKVIFLLPSSSKAVSLALQNLVIPELGHILYKINKE